MVQYIDDQRSIRDRADLQAAADRPLLNHQFPVALSRIDLQASHATVDQQEARMGKLLLLLEGILAAWFMWRGLYPDFYDLIDVTALGLMCAGIAAISAVLLRWKSHKIFQSTIQWSIFVGSACFITLLIAFKVPMRVGFLTARAGLSQQVEISPHAENMLAKDVRIGLYTFSASETNRRYLSGIGSGKYRVFFLAGNRSEAAFIYSTEGIEDLIYNRGSRGHLFGNWYWMKED